jgi:RNA polymerase sigma-70 factor, ECF subfamily
VSEPTADVEETIQDAFRAGDYARAATRALEVYGPELLSFLIARLRSESDGEEAFAMFAEALWKGLPSFELRCSVRCYLYTLARNSAARYASSPHNRRKRHVSLASENGALAALIDGARSATQLHKRTDVKSKVRALRDGLAADDQLLLILYIDRALPWREVAMVMNEQGETLDEHALAREAARLRKRYERVKAELKALAQREGLLEG